MKRYSILVVSIIAVIAAHGCASQKRISELILRHPDAEIVPLEAKVDSALAAQRERDNALLRARQDSIDKAMALEREMLSESLKDTTTGQTFMQRDSTGTLTETLGPSFVVGRSRTRKVKGGKVALEFEVHVPDSTFNLSKDWCVNLKPRLVLLHKEIIATETDTTSIREVYADSALNKMVLSGEAFRERQMKGYERYNKFVSSIVTDSTTFQDKHQLEVFLQRNLPGIYKFKNDSSVVSEKAFLSAYGVNEEQAIEHYTRKFSRTINRIKEENKERVFNFLVKNPIEEDGIQLDTVYKEGDDFIYEYSTIISTKHRKDLNHALIYLDGDIANANGTVFYHIPQTDSVDFPISTVKDFIRDTTVYKIGHRQVYRSDNKEYKIAFGLGKYNVDLNLGDNKAEIDKIRKNIRELVDNEMYTLDSIVVTAAASPEGGWNANATLANKRARSVIDYVEPFGRHLRDSIYRTRRDSLRKENAAYGELPRNWADNVIGELTEEEKTLMEQKAKEEEEFNRRLLSDIPTLTFTSHSEPRYWKEVNPEYWEKLDRLVFDDTLQFNEESKAEYEKLYSIGNDDSREVAMKKYPWYSYVKENFYPQLRVTRFDFQRRLKKAEDETYITDEVDEIYQEALAAAKDNDWETALQLFTSNDQYKYDYNLGVTYVQMSRYLSACEVLEHQKSSPEVDFMLAQVYFYLDREADAVEAFKRSYHTGNFDQDMKIYGRGVKDPDLGILIRKNKLESPKEEKDKADLEAARKAAEAAGQTLEEPVPDWKLAGFNSEAEFNAFFGIK